MMQCYFEFFMECGNLITLGFLIQENYSTLIHKLETQFEFKNVKHNFVKIVKIENVKHNFVLNKNLGLLGTR